MPTRKQRRRREKGRRHEYEYVYVDEEGREVEADEPESERPPAPSRNGRRENADAVRLGRNSRALEPPSWRRVGKRSLIFAPFMFVVITLLERDLPILTRALFTLQMLLLFVPFSYVMDTLTYRIARRRAEGAASKPRSRRA